MGWIGIKVKCSDIDINDLLACTVRMIHSLTIKIKNKMMDDLKSSPLLLSKVTPLWIEAGVPRLRRCI